MSQAGGRATLADPRCRQPGNGCPFINEFVLRPPNASALPELVAAFFHPTTAGVPCCRGPAPCRHGREAREPRACVAKARSARAAHLKRFGLAAEAAPLLELRLDDWSEPFRVAR